MERRTNDDGRDENDGTIAVYSFHSVDWFQWNNYGGW